MSRVIQSDEFRDLCQRLQRQPAKEGTGDWPAQQLRWLGDAGGWRWNMPQSCGGLGCSSVEMLQIYRDLSACCLTTAFVLTQRNAACQRLLQAREGVVSTQLLQDLAAGRVMATVGISHLTTSRQYLANPAVLAEPVAGGWVLTGTVPWATGAASSQLLVTGATTESGLQLLAVVPLPQDAVSVGVPAELLGLSAACTSEVRLSGVYVLEGDVLQGPAERVLSGGSGSAPAAGSLSTSAVALGFAEGALAGFSQEAELRGELVPYVQRLRQESRELWEQLLRSANGVGELTAEQLRGRSNSLALRTAQAWLAATRGAGYQRIHPASRAVRESLFFLVWSCPQAVLEWQLQELTMD
jgi:alkylation response protein AidB-like acyl-CoA dehydrogenase